LTIYVIRRLLLIIPTLFMVTILVFLLSHFIPGDAIDILAAELEQVTGEQVDREMVAHLLGLDMPIHEQYGRWVGNIILHGDFGTSLRSQYSVGGEIAARVPVTFELGILAIIIGAIIAIPIGILSAIRQDTLADYVGRSFSIVMISVPVFWVATIVMIYPSIWWGWSPPMELIPFIKDPMGNLGMFLLPAFIMGLGMTGGTMRMVRTTMLEVLRQDYIRTAWAKGLKERVVIFRHGLKNAMMPVVTIMGYQLPLILGGSVIIEQIFCLPGMGRLMLQSLNQRDYPVVSALNLIMSAFVMFVNLAVDMTYAFLDPRVRYT